MPRVTHEARSLAFGSRPAIPLPARWWYPPPTKAPALGGGTMKFRRAVLLVTLALGILAVPLSSDAQQPGKVFRVGSLEVNPLTPANSHLADAFRRGLRDLGYTEGQNLVIEWRYAEGKRERLPALAAELVKLKVDVIVAWNTPAAEAAKQVTGTVPIVAVTPADPVGSGLVASLARPGGNVTGLTILAPELSGKRLQLLKEVVPRASRVAVLWNPAHPIAAVYLRETEVAARALGVQLQVLEARVPNDFASAFSAMTKERAQALVVLPDPMSFVNRRQLLELAAKNRLPLIADPREFAEDGGLMAYGTNYADLFRRAATYVDKILKGAKPGDLPVEQPTKFELIINFKTAKALGLTIPQSVLIRADYVIQ